MCGTGNGIGRLGDMTDPAGETTYCYERRGLLASFTTADLVAFTYDADGNRTSILYPSGRTVTYGFDYADRPVTAAVGGTPLVTSAAYLPYGPRTQLAFGNGTSQTTSFDSRYRPAELTGASGTIADYTYAEDADGNITQIHDGVNAAYNRDFGYDDLNRLTVANSGGSLWGNGSYHYDAMGNVLSVTAGGRNLSFSYAGSTPKVALVTGSASEASTYDAAGNETTSGYFSARNLLARVGDLIGSQGQAIDYGYDGRGVRITADWHPDGLHEYLRRYVYSPELHLLGQSSWATGPFLDGVSSPFEGTEYVWLGDVAVAQVPTDPALSLRFTFTDHLGTPLLQTDSAQNVVWRAEYEPFGRVFAYRAANQSDEQVLRLPGQEAGDDGNSTSYNVFRWYRSDWGRYTQGDPLGEVISSDDYGYVAENPLTHVDPWGLYSTKPGDAAGDENTIVCSKGRVTTWIKGLKDTDHKRCHTEDCVREHELVHAVDATKKTRISARVSRMGFECTSRHQAKELCRKNWDTRKRSIASRSSPRATHTTAMAAMHSSKA